jgi:hypothetical protein
MIVTSQSVPPPPPPPLGQYAISHQHHQANEDELPMNLSKIKHRYNGK